MNYKELRAVEFFKEMNSEARAREWLWKSKCGGKDFECTKCGHEEYWQHKHREEVRQCTSCKAEIRLRAGTIFEHSKTSMLTWVHAIYFVMQSKRGISAMELKRQLNHCSYGTVWTMLQKIRRALWQRNAEYELSGLIELDGTTFGKRKTGNQKRVMVAVESIEWVDKHGEVHSKAGFAKVKVTPEKWATVQSFIKENIDPTSKLHVDGARALGDLQNIKSEAMVMDQDKELLDTWLPWVHRFISNAKQWVLGTHHGVSSKYLEFYLSEYTYRFNRRHDMNSLFHRALTACALASPITQQVLRR